MVKLLLNLVVVFFVISCSEKNVEEVLNDKIQQSLILNEYAPKGVLLNESNEPSDWIELKNISTNKILVDENEWSITDDINEPAKYYLPKMEVDAGKFIIIWCDKGISTAESLHSNFKLSGNGERIALFQNGNLVDQVIFDQDVKKGYSYGRGLQDKDIWMTFEEPTPGKPNALLDYYAKSLE